MCLPLTGEDTSAETSRSSHQEARKIMSDDILASVKHFAELLVDVLLVQYLTIKPRHMAWASKHFPVF